MKAVLVGFVCLFAVESTDAQTLSDKERKFAIDLLEANAQKFLVAIEHVSDEQWKFKPAPDAWSVGDISEHITLAEDLLFSIVQKTLQDPADTGKAKALEGGEKLMLDKISNRSNKSQAPDVIRPSGKFSNKKELIEAFKTVRAKTIHYIKTTGDPLKNHVAFHPAVGELTAYQWLVFIAGHADRHVEQLNEVKGNNNFPKM